MADRIVIAPAWQAVLRDQGLDSVSAFLGLTSGELVKHRPSTEVRRITLPDGRTLFIKTYAAHGFGPLWSGALRGTLFGRSRVRREYTNLEQLRACGFSAPAPVAYGERRRGGWVTRSFLASEGILDPFSLDRYIVVHRNPADRRRLIDRLAAEVRRLHDHRFTHADLYWRNIILNGRSTDRFYLIDCHKGRRWPVRGELPGRADDLACLDAPAPLFFRRPERLRFLLRYLDRDRLTPADKAFARRILALADPLRERQYRRVRELRG